MSRFTDSFSRPTIFRSVLKIKFFFVDVVDTEYQRNIKYWLSDTGFIYEEHVFLYITLNRNKLHS